MVYNNTVQQRERVTPYPQRYSVALYKIPKIANFIDTGLVSPVPAVSNTGLRGSPNIAGSI